MSASYSVFRDEFQSLLGGPRERRRVLREIKQLEAEELRRLHAGANGIGGGGDEDIYPNLMGGDGYDATYLTQPAPLQGLEGNRGARGGSAGAGGGFATETLYGRPASAYSRGSSPSMVLTAMEEELDPAKVREKMLQQRAHAANMSVPRVAPDQHFTNFMKAPSAMRKRGLRSPDVLFEPGTTDGGVFWLYDKHRVSQSTLGSAASSMAYASGGGDQAMDEATFKKLPVWANIKRKLGNMIAQGAQQERFGIVFDIVSTGKILAKGIPHMAGKLIYEYVEDCRHEAGVNKLKFIFVGITDNINCCTARDVFCLDDRVGGVYVGDFKRPFTALDNVHMFAVLPPSGSRFYDQVLHAREPGYVGTMAANMRQQQQHGGSGGPNASSGAHNASTTNTSNASALAGRKTLPPMAPKGFGSSAKRI